MVNTDKKKKVTILRNLWDKHPKHVPIDYVIKRISEDTVKDKILLLRASKDAGEGKRVKESLPCVLFSGVFFERFDDKIIEHSGLICLDFDDFPSREGLIAYKKKLIKDPYTYILFESPQANGVKLVVKTTDKTVNHRKHFLALKEYYSSPHFDSTSINESRACFLSYDPNIYVNEDAEIFTKLYEPKQHKDEKKNINHYDDDTIKNLYKWWDKSFGFIEGQRNRNIYILAMAFNEFGVSETGALSFLLQFTRPDFTDREIRNCIKSAYKKTHLHNTKSFSSDTVNDFYLEYKSDDKIGFNVFDVFDKSYIDVREPLVRQPVALSMGTYNYRGEQIPRSWGTYGNFSCLVGASKSKKTFLKSMLAATYMGDASFYCSGMKSHKDKEMFILDIDTEQGVYDAQRCFKRVMDLCSIEYSKYYKPFALRPYEPKERLQFVEWLIYESDYRDNIGLVLIDGIVDLAYDFNDLKESSSLIQKIMRWTNDKQFHLITIIHTNPGSSKPSGHLGTSILKKAETICEVDKVSDDRSEVRFPYTRGMGINKFEYEINSEGLPYVIDPLDKSLISRGVVGESVYPPTRDSCPF